ncbi:MAG: nitrous oxide reductase family maturation protein NosD, partial [Promethearchaeota archaeon]
MLKRYSNISKNKKKLIIILVFFSFFILACQLPIDCNPTMNPSSREGPNALMLKTSYFNNSCEPINISGNAEWEALAANPWCTKDNGVYYLENLTINGGGSGNCIEISNSTVPFVIRNCTLLNSGTDLSYAGIKLKNVSNGQLIENNCFNNSVGICLTGSTTDRWATNGTCQNITIVRNNIIENQLGLALVSNASRNSVLDNTLLYNSMYGIGVGFLSSENNFTNNLIVEGEIGIYLLAGAINNTFYDNEIHDMSEAGIAFNITCTNNTISTNEIYNNKHGIFITNTSSYNTFCYNNIFNNGEYGVIIDNSSGECSYNLFYQNRFDNPEGVNALDNCSNNQWDN